MREADMSFALKTQDAQTVLYWYDFLCPFCYAAQSRNAIFERYGLAVIKLPFQAHPDIPPGGIDVGPRSGPMYTTLEREAKVAGLPLNWPLHLPNTRLVLAAAEWVRQYQPRAFLQFHKDLFEAHFVLGEDLEDLAIIDRHASKSGIDLAALHAALADGSAAAAAMEAEVIGRKNGVHGTPAWLLRQRLIEGLLPAAEFKLLVERAMQLPG